MFPICTHKGPQVHPSAHTRGPRFHTQGTPGFPICTHKGKQKAGGISPSAHTRGPRFPHLRTQSEAEGRRNVPICTHKGPQVPPSAHTRGSRRQEEFSSTNINSHQETVSGQACVVLSFFFCFFSILITHEQAAQRNTLLQAPACRQNSRIQKRTTRLAG